MHLLVVEDDARLRAMLQRLLLEDRHVVEVADSGEEALDVLAGDCGLDAMILDVGLPRMSGLDLARQLRNRRSRVPILMLTARDAVEQRVAGLDAGADDYLVKPLLGVMAGAAAAAAYATSQGWMTVVPPVAIGGGLAAAIVIGAVAGLYPAARAARVSPTQALRTT